MTNLIEVFKGEANENIIIDTKDTLGATVDVSWASNESGDTIIEVKDKPGGVVKTTLTETDIVSFSTTAITVKGDKFFALAGGNYFLKFTFRDTGTREKIFTGYLNVHDV